MRLNYVGETASSKTAEKTMYVVAIHSEQLYSGKKGQGHSNMGGGLTPQAAIRLSDESTEQQWST
jgi:hypothetical protein